MADEQNYILLKNKFRDYLIDCGYDIAQAGIISNNAFYLQTFQLGYTIEDFLSGEKSLAEYKEFIIKRLSLSGNTDLAKEKAENYVLAMELLITFNKGSGLGDCFISHTPTETSNTNTNELLEYCQKMRMNYSYKPLFILAMLDNLDNSNKVPLVLIANWFLNFYSDRRSKCLIVEKDNSFFISENINLDEAKNNIINNAAKVLEKDKIVLLSGDYASFTKEIFVSISGCKEDIKKVCKELIDNYYLSISTSPKKSNDNKSQEYELGLILSNMYKNAPKCEKVSMIILFGIKYSSIITKESLSIKKILSSAGLRQSYYAEIRKGIRLANYVDAKITN